MAKETAKAADSIKGSWQTEKERANTQGVSLGV